MNAALPASLLLATAIFAAPAEWPQFRGPARDGVSAETGLLKEWPKDGPPLAWQIKGLGRGLASIAISGGKILTVAKRKDGQFVVALDLATQKELWSARVSEKGEDPQGAPCVDGNLVFAVSKDGRVLCCEASDGKEVWHKDFAEFGGR
jgi:outer membrane protein assembly factor BamB